VCFAKPHLDSATTSANHGSVPVSHLPPDVSTVVPIVLEPMILVLLAKVKTQEKLIDNMEKETASKEELIQKLQGLGKTLQQTLKEREEATD